LCLFYEKNIEAAVVGEVNIGYITIMSSLVGSIALVHIGYITMLHYFLPFSHQIIPIKFFNSNRKKLYKFTEYIYSLLKDPIEQGIGPYA